MVDWTQLTDDPNNAEAKEAVRRYLGSVRQVHLDVDLLPFIESLAAGRSVLIARAAKRCLGADIIESLVKELKARGYDVVCADATSEHVVATTPNRFSRKFHRRFRAEGTPIMNLDHVAWITPTNALEIVRRFRL